MSEHWCVTVYHTEGGVEIVGPFNGPDEAGIARARLAQEANVDAAYRVRMVPPR